MDIEEKLKLKELYKEMPEQQLIDMLSEDQDSFQNEAYLFLIEEVKRRGLEDKLNQIREAKKEKNTEKNEKEYKFVKVFTTPNSGEIAVIKSILDAQDVPYYIKGENFGTIYGAADGLSAMDILVREDYSEDVKELLKDFIIPGA